MRYQRHSYRYALVLGTGSLRPLGRTSIAERPGVQLAQTWWRPAADVYETSTAFMVTVDLAGIDHEELDVLLYEDAVIVEGHRRHSVAEARGVYHTVEIHRGSFRLELALPAPIDPERVIAHYERGLLQMTLPKPEGR
jgi:HSP20 family protein